MTANKLKVEEILYKANRAATNHHFHPLIQLLSFNLYNENTSQFPKAQDDAFKLLVLFDQKSKT